MKKSVINTNSDIYLDYGYLMLPISLNIISKINIGNQTFFSKNGYHVSLLRLKDFSETDQRNILNFAKEFPVRLKTVTEIYRLVSEKDRLSIIVRVHLRGLKKLISAVNNHFGYSFIYPPTHITLFALKDMDGGIGVNSTNDYRKLTHRIGQKDAQRLTKSFNLIV
jgi:hypothetical protein